MPKMFSTSKFISLLSLVTSGNALTFTNRNFDDITPGKAFNITWMDAEGPVDLTLFQGGTAVNTWFKNAGEIAKNITTGYYIWTPDTSLIRDVYTIRFEDSTDSPIYGFQFQLLSPVESATTTTLVSTTTSYASTVWAYPTYLGCDGLCPSVI
ncbi:hypothetical protein N7528_006580 [Penicillium herquei]|nr:hypothetical protein N7528_006580 [Penicillium herquei]